MRRGQALIELAIGLFALSLVVCALCVFVRFIAKSLNIQNHIRSSERVFAAKVEIDKYAAEKIFGVDTLHVKEPHGPTDRTVPFNW